MKKPSLAPFSCSFTREVPDILAQLECSLALTTYQAGKVILVSPVGESLVQLIRNFKRPMGLTVQGSRMAVATHHEVVVLQNAPALASTYPNKPNHYDALYVPQTTYTTGTVDIHDMAWSGNTLWAVNTVFSCLCHIDTTYSFRPVWKPSFVSEIAPGDRCHLNGLAMENGAPKYVTAVAATDAPRAWTDKRMGGGVLIDVPSGEIVLTGLSMPHSPRLYDGKLYLLNSAEGHLLRADPQTGTYESIKAIPGFARGIAKYGDYLFIGHSKIRKKHLFGDLPISQAEHNAGVIILHEPSGAIAGALTYHTACEEIYDIQVLPDVRRPGILGVENEMYGNAIVTPTSGYWANTEKE